MNKRKKVNTVRTVLKDLCHWVSIDKNTPHYSSRYRCINLWVHQWHHLDELK